MFRNCSSNYLQTSRLVIYDVKCQTAEYQSPENPLQFYWSVNQKLLWTDGLLYETHLKLSPVPFPTYAVHLIEKLQWNTRRKLWPSTRVDFSSPKRENQISVCDSLEQTKHSTPCWHWYSVQVLIIASFVPPTFLSTSTWLWVTTLVYGV
jgi:hypothetical protein